VAYRNQQMNQSIAVFQVGAAFAAFAIASGGIAGSIKNFAQPCAPRWRPESHRREDLRGCVLR
jgi:hypothetical protein